MGKFFQKHIISSHQARLALVLWGAWSLTACAFSPHSEDGLVKQAATLVGLASPVGEPADFIKDQRPVEPRGYLPVGVTPSSQGEKPRNAAEVQALEAEMNAQRDKSRAFANRPAPKSAYGDAPPPKVEKPPPNLMPQ